MTGLYHMCCDSNIIGGHHCNKAHGLPFVFASIYGFTEGMVDEDQANGRLPQIRRYDSTISAYIIITAFFSFLF